jgi:hypothetical protein
MHNRFSNGKFILTRKRTIDFFLNKFLLADLFSFCVSLLSDVQLNVGEVILYVSPAVPQNIAENN